MNKKSRNPFELPGWMALKRESTLVRHLLGSGATALGRANYADQAGEYYTAFFGLSVGLERLAKLVLVVEHALSHSGTLPPQGVVSKYGHHLVKLLDQCEEIQNRRHVARRFARPRSEICSKIIECLDAFADARRGRYANFAALGDPNIGSEFEPLRKWWEEVAEAILRVHYYGKRAQTRVESNAQMADAALSRISYVLHFDETGGLMADVLTAATRTGQTEIVQKYGRYYSLTVVRWLSALFSELSEYACYQCSFDEFFGHAEHFTTYTVDDSFLKTRKVWPLK